MKGRASIVVGIDVGTTSVKVAAFRITGECLFSEGLAYPTFSPGPKGWVEQDPEDWIRCIRKLCAKMNAQLGMDQELIVGMGIVSQVNTHVFVDRDHKPLMNAIVWQDQRCGEVAENLDVRIDSQLRSECWGEGFVIDASFLMSRAEWVREHEPRLWEDTSLIMSPKDYCLMRLTHECATDAISSIGLVGLDGKYLQRGIDVVPGLMEKLAPIKAIYDPVGNVDSSVIKTSCPAFNCTMDAWGSLFGSGIASAGRAFQVSGTSEICGITSDQSLPANGVISFPPFFGWHFHAGPTQMGGEAANWFAKFMGISIENVFARAELARDRKNPLIFLPHIMGERAPLWDSTAAGAFIGLNKQHDMADMSKSVLESVGHSSRLLFSSLISASGITPDCVYLSGGAAKSDLWCQIKADILDVPLHRLKNLDTGVFGAALISMVGLKIYDDLQEATDLAVTVDRVFFPDGSSSDYYDSLHGQYLNAYEALKPANKALSALALL